MMLKKVTENLYEIPLSNVNAHLIQTDDELILIDTGSAGDERKIAKALSEISRKIADLTHIMVTHCHPDHAGSLAALQEQTAAPTFMHRADAALVENGTSVRPMNPTPGLLNRLLFRIFIAPAPKTIAPGRVEQRIEDEETLSLAGGIRVIHTPGHSEGQIALLWEQERVLFVADAVMNLPRLNYSLGYEDYAEGQRSAAKLAQLDFDIACFGHGKPLVGDANTQFQRKFISNAGLNSLTFSVG